MENERVADLFLRLHLTPAYLAYFLPGSIRGLLVHFPLSRSTPRSARVCNTGHCQGARLVPLKLQSNAPRILEAKKKHRWKGPEAHQAVRRYETDFEKALALGQNRRSLTRSHKPGLYPEDSLKGPTSWPNKWRKHPIVARRPLEDSIVAEIEPQELRPTGKSLWFVSFSASLRHFL